MAVKDFVRYAVDEGVPELILQDHECGTACGNAVMCGWDNSLDEVGKVEEVVLREY